MAENDLAQAYLRELGRAGDAAEIAPARRAVFDAGRLRWPAVVLPADGFAAGLARAVGATDATAIAALREEVYLAVACAAGEPHALAAFEQRYVARVPEFIAHLRRPPAFVDEVAQRLREKLLVAGADDRRPRITDYAGRGSLEGWVRVAAVRLALDLIEADGRHGPMRAAPDDDLFGVTSDPELAYIKQRYLPHFRAAFGGAVAALLPEERNLLRFYVVDQLNIADIGKLFGKSRATIGRWIVDCRERLVQVTRRELAAQLGADSRDVDSLLTVLQSQLDVSLRTVLIERAGD
jgi:RNA polymerase sigma-70 factor (ECF subfamily)